MNKMISLKKSTIVFIALFGCTNLYSQTNVFDNVIATSPQHTYLEAALIQTGLDQNLRDPNATLTVFAPDDAAFDALAVSLNTTISGLLALPNLADILTYHVLGSEVPASGVTNGAIVTPLFTGNTLKLTKTTAGAVFVNHASVTTADVEAENGVVHVLDAVVLPTETVVDVAIDNGFTTLATAVVEARLLPALTDPFATLTVFAPTNVAFDELAVSLNTTVTGLLALPNLADILTYHVLGSEVPASGVTNGAIVTPLFAGNTLKLTKTTAGAVFVNHASVTTADVEADNGVVHVLDAVVLPTETVVDVAIDNGFTTLATAVVEARLLPALTDPFATLTVFAPTNAAFDELAVSLNTTVTGLLALPNLASILTYHVLGSEVPASGVTNGAIVTPLFTGNTLKLTKTTAGAVFVNHASVTTADVEADNGVVHVLDAVVLPTETVVDVAIDNGFTTLATAVVEARLLPALTDPFATLTVFAPTNAAFDDLADELNTTVAGLLALPNLASILTYHVLGSEVAAAAVTNGAIVTPLFTGNTLKLTKTTGGEVFVNQAAVTTADVQADNGVVHVLEEVVLPVETVVDVAIDNGFTTLAAAVIEARLLPALTDPFASLTVFAPTNTAFDELATALNTTVAGLLALPNLEEILTYHVIGSELNASDLTNGLLETLNGADVVIATSQGVTVNDATVTTPDVEADNGVVHVIDKVIFESFLNIAELEMQQLVVYPNPSVDFVQVSGLEGAVFQVYNSVGQVVANGTVSGNQVDLRAMTPGIYYLNVLQNNTLLQAKITKL